MDFTILVNKSHPITQAFIDGLDFSTAQDVQGNPVQVEKETYQAFLQLQADCLQKDGVEIGIASGFRSIAFQENVYAEFLKKYGKAYADEVVAAPATSEHHTGMALDIIPRVNGVFSLDNRILMTYQEYYAPIYARMSQYGFILRYEQGKEAVTGYPYEPWLFRYVGKAAAAVITQKHMTLEEYTADAD